MNPTGTKVFQLIQSFASGEEGDVSAFLQSPMGSQNLDLAEGFRIALKTLSRKTTRSEASTDEELRLEIKKRLFPALTEKKFDTQFRKYLSELLRALEKYVIWNQVTSSEILHEFLLARGISERNISLNLFQFLFNQVRTRVEKTPGDSDKAFYTHKLCEYELNFLMESQSRQMRPEMTELSRHFSDYAYTRGLKIYCAMRVQQLIFEQSEIPPFYNRLLGWAREFPEELDPLGALYARAALILNEEKIDVASFRNYLDAISDHGQNLRAEEWQSLFRLAVTMSALAQRQNRENTSLALETYERMFTHPGLAELAMQTPIHITNYIRLKLQYRPADAGTGKLLKEVEDWMPRMPDTLRENVREYIRGLAAYYEKRWQAAFDSLSIAMATTRDPFIRLSCMKYKIRVLFEAGDVLIKEKKLPGEPGPRSGDTLSPLEKVLERYRKASDFTSGITPRILSYHRLLYRNFRELCYLCYGDDAKRNLRLRNLDELKAENPPTEDFQWMQIQVEKYR